MWLRLNFRIHKEIISRQSFEILAFRICENTVVAESLQRTAAVVWDVYEYVHDMSGPDVGLV